MSARKDNLKDKEKKAAKVSYHHKPDDMSVDSWQTELRRQFAETQNFRIKNTGSHPVFSDFEVYNPQSGNTYKVAVRSEDAGMNFCSCPDFKTNTLGTCKHIEFTLFNLKNSDANRAIFKEGYQRPYSSVTLRYGQVLRALAEGKTSIGEIANISGCENTPTAARSLTTLIELGIVEKTAPFFSSAPEKSHLNGMRSK
ncbi:MAG: hypothetical protein PH343_06210 [Nitrospira sp.]|nr:hypothetical protein [Nitrospira sp.]